MKLKNIKVRGIEIEVSVDSDGFFRADLTDKHYAERTLEALEKTLMKASKEASAVVSIQGKVLDRGEWRTVTGYGVHAGTGNVLYQIGVEKRQTQHSRYEVFQTETPVETLARYATVVDTVRKLDAEKRIIEKTYQFDLYDATVKAVRVEAMKLQEANHA